MATQRPSPSHCVRHNGHPKQRQESFGHVPLHAGDARRSVQNIARWNDYLPTECVRTMVRMGWDYTT
jgi:hypothetical protein